MPGGRDIANIGHFLCDIGILTTKFGILSNYSAKAVHSLVKIRTATIPAIRNGVAIMN